MSSPTLTKYRLKIVGVQYAANPDYIFGDQETEEIRGRTFDLLNMIKETKPLVVLKAEPTNTHNPQAVMARILGKKVGYVCDEDLDVVHALMMQAGRKMLITEVSDVVVYEHGYFYVNQSGLPLNGVKRMDVVSNWSILQTDLPELPPSENQQAEEEAAFMLEETMLPRLNEVNVTNLEKYLNIWLENSQHDLSCEARQQRSEFIERLEMSERPEVRQLSNELKHQRTGMCSRRMLEERTKVWWPSLLYSKETSRLWTHWQHEIEGKHWYGLHSIDTILRQLPGDLYDEIGQMEEMFSRMYYMNIPRCALTVMLSLLLLRELTCKELGIAMYPMMENDYQQDGLVTNLMEMPTTIGRVITYGKTQCATVCQRQTIQQLTYWLRDDYQQNHSKKIEELVETKPLVIIESAQDVIGQGGMKIINNK